MKTCPNPQCPFLLRHKFPNEFMDHVSTCDSCSTTLVGGQASEQGGMGSVSAMMHRRYNPIYGLAHRAEILGVVLVFVCGIAMLFTMVSDIPFVPFLSVFLIGAAIAIWSFSRIASALLRAFADTALWTAPGLSDAEKLNLATTMGKSMSDVLLGDSAPSPSAPSAAKASPDAPAP